MADLKEAGALLSGCAKVLDQFDVRTLRLMKASFEVPQQGCRRLPQRVPVRPPAVATQLLFDIAPDPLHQVQLGGVGGLEERAELVSDRKSVV
jgi:hypothetical protein